MKREVSCLVSVENELFDIKKFIKDIVEYCREELNDKDILWWVDSRGKGIDRDNEVKCVESEILNHISSDGSDIYIPFFNEGVENVSLNAIMPNGEVANLYNENFDLKDSSIGIEIKNLRGHFKISPVHCDGAGAKEFEFGEDIREKVINYITTYLKG